MAKLIFGCGYVGFRVALRWLDRGEEVFALTRSSARAAEFSDLGITPVTGDVARPFTLPPIESLGTVLYAVGFDRSSPHSIDDVYIDGFARALAELPAAVERIIYLSSTGVYGQSAGQWVDEDSPLAPQRAGGKAVLAAEQLLANHPLGARAAVLRLAGIYGPNRVPKLTDVQQGNPLVADGDSFLNLIHVDDVVEGILAAEKLTNLPARYIVSDGCPVRRTDFYGELARQLGVGPPRFVEPNRLPSTAQRELSSKRVRNARMMSDLLTNLNYPTYRQGLADVIRSAGE